MVVTDDSSSSSGGGGRRHWRELPAPLRDVLASKLEGLYGQTDATAAFDALAIDKQEALLLFTERLRALELWEQVERIENVYGEGGVGISFQARPGFGARLAESDRYTTRFALHRDCAEGFFERGRTRAVLHFLRTRAEADQWSVHFDLHAPVGTLFSALRHLWYEKFRRVTPDWRMIKKALVSAWQSHR